MTNPQPEKDDYPWLSNLLGLGIVAGGFALYHFEDIPVWALCAMVAFGALLVDPKDVMAAIGALKDKLPGLGGK